MTSSLASLLASQPEADRLRILAGLTEAQAKELLNDWRFWARPNQIAPDGDWQTWLALAGRGFGKTESGAQWVRERVKNGARSIALVAETQKDLEEVMVARIVAIHPKDEAPSVRYKPVRITWPNGAIALGYNGTEPDQLRGPQFDTAWCFIAGTLVETQDGQKPIEHIRPGELVMTRSGLRPVVSNATRCAMTGQVLFGNGSILVGTADHPVYTNHGWTRLDSVAGDDRICVSNAWTGAGLSGTSMAATTKGRSKKDRIGRDLLCTVKSTVRNMASFLTDVMFTTLMATSGITIRQTLSASQGQNTLNVTLTTPTGLDLSPEKKKPYIRLSLRAVGVKRLSSAKEKQTIRSALLACRKEPKRQEKLTVSACNAAAGSKAEVATFVRSGASTFLPLAEQEVFCLKVDGTPEYFANGILVHNCDELAKYRYARETWDMLQFTMRSGDDPRVFVTTTPKPIPVIREILADSGTVVTRGNTFDNAQNLPAKFLTRLKRTYENTRLGRQELYAEILDDLPGALWQRDSIDKTRVKLAPNMQRVVIAVDPSGTKGASDDGDSIGIVAAGKGIDGRLYVLADRTCKLSPDGWGRQAVKAYHEFKADRIVAERNFGGEMVHHVIQTVDRRAAYKEVTASRGKVVRAEPVAALYEQGRVSHVGGFADLEDQMCLMGPDGYVGEGSPDRVDALVWALTELMGGSAYSLANI